MAFQELLKKLSPKLKGITYKLNGQYSFFNDEDLFQEALLHLWQDFNAGKLDDKTDSYILQGCYFHLKNYIRKEKNKTRLVSLQALLCEEQDRASLEDTLSSEESRYFFDSFNNKILIEEILNDGLTSKEKQVFSLFLAGHTTREIGRMLGISHVSVVKSSKKIKEKCQKFKDPL